MKVSLESIIINVICFFIFHAIGIYANHTSKPMNFWAEDFGIINPYNMRDVKAYNKANAKMWKIYSLSYLISAFIAFFNETLSIITFVGFCTIGICILGFYYEKIKNKYMYDTKNYRKR